MSAVPTRRNLTACQDYGSWVAAQEMSAGVFSGRYKHQRDWGVLKCHVWMPCINKITWKFITQSKPPSATSSAVLKLIWAGLSMKAHCLWHTCETSRSAVLSKEFLPVPEGACKEYGEGLFIKKYNDRTKSNGVKLKIFSSAANDAFPHHFWK